MNNNNPADWAWPTLIQSLQRDVERLREAMDDARKETAYAREQHRKELDALIDQLRDLRNDISPLVKERDENKRLANETRWSWIERLGWLVMGGIALAVWGFIQRHLGE